VAARAKAEKKTVGRDYSGGDSSPVLQVSEHELDAAAPVAVLVVLNRLVAGFLARNAGLDAIGLQSISEPVSVIASVAK
jgi:hypothetical protein